MEVFIVLLWNISWRVFLLSDVLRVGEQVLWKDRPFQEDGPLASKNENRVLAGSAPMRHKRPDTLLKIIASAQGHRAFDCRDTWYPNRSKRRTNRCSTRRWSWVSK